MRLISLSLRSAFLLTIFGLLFVSCGNDDDNDDLMIVAPEVQIAQFMADNNITDTMMTSSGLVYVIDEAGNAEKPNLNDNITINYQGYLIDGTVFDETPGTPRSFPLGNLILSWQEGIQLIGRRGKIKLISPPNLAYGNRGSGALIKPGDVIVFDIELLDFN